MLFRRANFGKEIPELTVSAPRKCVPQSKWSVRHLTHSTADRRAAAFSCQRIFLFYFIFKKKEWRERGRL